MMDHNSLPQLSGKKVNQKRKSQSMVISRPWKYWKILRPAPKKPRKSKQINVISKQGTSDSSKPSETDDNPILSVIQEKEINLFSESSEWKHLSEFWISLVIQMIKTGGNRNFRKPFI